MFCMVSHPRQPPGTTQKHNVLRRQQTHKTPPHQHKISIHNTTHSLQQTINNNMVQTRAQERGAPLKKPGAYDTDAYYNEADQGFGDVGVDQVGVCCVLLGVPGRGEESMQPSGDTPPVVPHSVHALLYATTKP